MSTQLPTLIRVSTGKHCRRFKDFWRSALKRQGPKCWCHHSKSIQISCADTRGFFGWSDPPPPTAVCNFLLLVDLPRTLQQLGSAPEIPVRNPPSDVRTPPPPFWILDPRLNMVATCFKINWLNFSDQWRIWELSPKTKTNQDANIVHLYNRKGTRQSCANHHGISLLSIAGKILAHVLLNRLMTHLEHDLLPESQSGFRNEKRNNWHDLWRSSAAGKMSRTKHRPLYCVPWSHQGQTQSAY